jgi:D-serine dehydratase
MDTTRFDQEPLPATLKGLPSAAVGRPLCELGALGLSLLDGDLPLPVAVLKEEALAHNLAWMRGFAERTGTLLCPHGKTTMSPQLFQRQLAAGAWGMTAATASHVRTYRQFGVQRVLMANQLLGRANLDLVFDELEADPGFDFYTLVDSVEALAALQAGLARRPLSRPLQVLLEVGAPGGRTGVRGVEEGLALGQAVKAAAPAVALRGVEAFEGVFSGADEHRVELAVHTMLDTVATLARRGCEQGWFAPGPVLLTAGGSAFFDMAAAVLGAVAGSRELQVVLRSGCTLTHDSLHYARMQQRMRQRAGEAWGSGPGLQNALEVWALVQSVPEPARAICGLGKRDISHDLGLPQPIWWFRPGWHAAPQPVPTELRVTALNDQHAYVDSSAGGMPWRVGDLVGFGMGHPCTTFDKWPLLYTVDEHWRVVGGVRTWF